MLALVIGLSALLVAVVIVLIVRERAAAGYRTRYTATPEDVAAARAHSVATSRGSTLGQAAEHLAPLLPDMVERFSPGDWRFLGSPVDFVVFDGLGEGAVRRVVLVEVKSGRSRLSARQAQIESAIANRELEVDWLTVQVPQKTPASRRRPRPRTVDLPPEDA
jgi:predicted Holliday junction resolvase-like endonuclease